MLKRWLSVFALSFLAAACGDDKNDPITGEFSSEPTCGDDIDSAATEIEEVKTGFNNPLGLYTDCSTLYFVDAAVVEGAVYRLPLSTKVLDLVAADQAYPTSVVTDGTYAYWTVYEQPAVGGQVLRAPKDGSDDPVLFAEDLEFPNSIAMNDTHVYWANRGLGPEVGSVFRMKKNGQGETPIVSGLKSTNFISLTNHAVYISNSGTTTQDGSIVRYSIDDGTSEPLVSGLNNGLDIAFSDGRIYYVDGANGGDEDGSVTTTDTAGENPITLGDELESPYAITLDETNVYWTDDVGSSIWKAPRDGSTDPVLVAGEQANPLSILLVGPNVYWTTGDGKVMRAPR